MFRLQVRLDTVRNVHLLSAFYVMILFTIGLRELGLILGKIRYITLMLIIYSCHRFSLLHGSDPRTQPLKPT
jgi:hypothetical protein